MHLKAFKQIIPAVLVAAVLLLALAGCTGGDAPAPTGAPDATAAQTGAVATASSNTEAPVPTATQDFGDPADDPLSGAAIYDFTEDAPDNSGLYAADASLAALGDIFGEMPVLTVKVKDCGLPYCEGACVYTSMEDFGSLGFLAAAAHAAGEYPDWVYRGAAYLAVSGEAALNDVKLASALRGPEDINALALLPVRFAPRFSSDASLALGYRTAGGFLKFVLEKYGRPESPDPAGDKREFVEKLGLENDYDFRYEGLLDDCAVSFNVLIDDGVAENVLFPVVIESSTYTLYAQPLTDCRNVNELEALLYKLEVGKQRMRAFTEEHASEQLSVCRFDRFVTYYMINAYGFSYAQTGIVVLRLEAGAILHETVHQWIMPDYYDHWYYEGLADFLAYQGGEGESLSFVHSMARLAFAHPDAYSGGGVADYNNTPASARVPGDEFTYDQSCSLIAYICEAYSLDPILAVCSGSSFERDFEAAFGKSFESVAEEWREWLETA